jgi:hypothetical protein
MGIFSKGPDKAKRDRSLSDEFPERESIDNTNRKDSEQELVEKAFSGVRENIELANKIMPLFEDKCRATHIPVPSAMQDITAAVARKDSVESTGSRISFSLFLTAIKKYEELNLKYTLKIVENTTGNPDLDSTMISELKISVILGIKPEDFDLFNSVWLLNYSINKFHDIFQIPTMMQVSVTEPGGATLGAMKIIIAAAFASAVDLLNELLRTGGTPDTVVGTSGQDAVFTRIDELALEKIAENDYKIILNYAIKYIYSSPDPKYSPWVSYFVLRQSRNSEIDTYSYYPTYSRKEFISINAGINSPDSNGDEGDYVEDYIKSRFLERMEESVGLGDMTKNVSTLVFHNSARQRDVINNAAQTGAYKMTKDQICCLLRILAKQKILDKKTFKMLRCLIRAVSKTLTYDVSARFAKPAASRATTPKPFKGLYYDRLKNTALNMLNKIFKKLVKDANSAIMEELYTKCRMFYMMLENLLGFTEGVVDELTKTTDSAQNSTSGAADEHEAVLQAKWEYRILSDTELVLSAIIDQALWECYEMPDDVVDNIVDNITIGLDIPSNQYTIDIPDDLRERHFSDNRPIVIRKKSNVFGLDSKITIPAIDKFNQPETSEEVIRNILKTCKMEISDEEIKNMLKESDEWVF